jgi:predicted membrane channel-forming protein YqfA (hemolysin III family)
VLSVVLYVIGALMLLIAAVGLLVGGVFAIFLPQLIIGGLVLIVGLAIERWRYKPLSETRPDPRWSDTGERFVDPETHRLTAVYFDATTGERHYIVVSPPDLDS